MTTRRDFAWGRWIRVSVAHHYLAVNRHWFSQHIRPELTVIKISKQARAFIRAEIDEVAERLERQSRESAANSGHGNRPYSHEKGVTHQPTLEIKNPSRTSLAVKIPELASNKLPHSNQGERLQNASNKPGSNAYANRVLASLSKKLLPGI